jgi:hypothetical protein
MQQKIDNPRYSMSANATARQSYLEPNRGTLLKTAFFQEKQKKVSTFFCLSMNGKSHRLISENISDSRNCNTCCEVMFDV